MLARGAHLAGALAQAFRSGSPHAARTTHSTQVHPLASYIHSADSRTPSPARRCKTKPRDEQCLAGGSTEPETDAALVMLDPAKTIDS